MTIPSMVYRWFRPHEPNHIPRRRDTSAYSFSTYLYLLTYCASSFGPLHYADESEAGVTPPVSCFYVSRLPHLPTYFEPRGHPQTETSNPNRPEGIWYVTVVGGPASRYSFERVTGEAYHELFRVRVDPSRGARGRPSLRFVQCPTVSRTPRRRAPSPKAPEASAWHLLRLDPTR